MERFCPPSSDVPLVRVATAFALMLPSITSTYLKSEREGNGFGWVSLVGWADQQGLLYNTFPSLCLWHHQSHSYSWDHLRAYDCYWSWIPASHCLLSTISEWTAHEFPIYLLCKRVNVCVLRTSQQCVKALQGTASSHDTILSRIKQEQKKSHSSNTHKPGLQIESIRPQRVWLGLPISATQQKYFNEHVACCWLVPWSLWHHETALHSFPKSLAPSEQLLLLLSNLGFR